VNASVTPSWDQLGARLYPFVRKRVASDADADDVLQDVLLRMHRGLPSLQDETRMAAWMYRIARTSIADHQRARARHPLAKVGELPELLGASEGADEDAVSRMVAQYLSLLIVRLPSPYREAITLTELEGRSQREAAKMLGVSVSCIKSRVQRGRAKLRELLEKCCEIALDSRGKIIACEPRSDCTG
jgi:RNA polymerase sigma-70 factor (ECF subfamily)